MTDSKDIDVLLKFCEEQYIWCRHSESERSTMTNFIITIAAALVAFIGYVGFDIKVIPSGFFLLVLGIYGTLMTLKYHERFRLHLRLAGEWANKIDEICPNANLNSLTKKAFQEHRKKYSKLSEIKLSKLWVFIHILISLLGLAFIIIGILPFFI